jgi:hypothetical protein
MRTWLYIVASIILVLSTAAGFAAMIAYAPKADHTVRDAQGCIRDKAPPSTTVMLVDFTDKATAAQQSQLTRAVGELRRGVPRDGKAIIALLDVSAESATAIALDVCNPGTKAGDYTDRPTPAPQDQRWRQVYYAPFDQALERARQSPQSENSSPILEAVTALSQRADFDAAIQNRKLIVVSDGLQLTPGVYSHFKDGDPWKAYQRSALPAQVQADLTGVDVEFVYLFRPEFARRQTDKHRAFLKKWFEAHGARSFTLRGIAENGES